MDYGEIICPLPKWIPIIYGVTGRSKWFNPR